MTFKQCGSLTRIDSDDPMQLPIKPIETPNAVQSVALQSQIIQLTCKGSDQTAHMYRLICCFAHRIYRGSYMSAHVLLISLNSINSLIHEVEC